MAYALQFDGVNDYVLLDSQISNPIPIGKKLTISGVWENNGLNFQMFIDTYSPRDFFSFTSAGALVCRINESSASTSNNTISSGDSFIVEIERTSTDYDISLNNVLELSISQGATNLDPLTGFSDPDNFGTLSEYVLVGSSGISVTGSTPALSYSAINSSINLTGEVAISGTTTNYFYSSVNSSVSLVPSIDIIGNTTSYYYDSVNISIDLIGLISVVGLSTNYSYSAASASIALQGSISFTASSTNYAYNALNGTIILKGPVVLNPKNLIRVSRENNTIRVKRNNNIVRVR